MTAVNDNQEDAMTEDATALTDEQIAAINPADYVKKSGRYALIGARMVDHGDPTKDPDANKDVEPDHQKVDEVVGHVDDKRLGNRIARRGGFMDSDGEWIAVEGWRDTDKPPSGGAIRKSDN